MNRTSWKCLLIVSVVAIALSAAAPQVEAYWGCGGCGTAWSCYSPCYSSCYTSCYTPAICWDPCGCGGNWYLGYRPGPIRRLLFGSCKWYWGGNCGWSCGYPSYDCGCGGVSTCGCATGSYPPAPAPAAQTPTPAKKPVIEPNSTLPTEPAPEPGNMPAMPGMSPPGGAMPAPATSPQTNATSADTSGILTVWVPYDAKVTVNGLKTTSTGSRRQFISYGLKPGFSYKYVVKAEVIQNGQLVEDTRTVTMTAGEITAVAFGFNAPAGQVAAQ